MSDRRPALLVIAGTTASGKTDAAIALARELGGEIVGADSVQVYRGFDVGSAKPTAAELGGVAHHMIDLREPPEELDAVRYAQLADEAIAGIAARGALPIVAGGTGLWLRALLRGLVDVPPVDPRIRSRLEDRAEREGTAVLHGELAAVDPLAAGGIHKNDRVRIVRALEVHEQTGKALGALRAAHALGSARYPCLFTALDLPREELATRVAERTARMIDAGWIDETRRLIARYGADLRPLRSVGYRQVCEHLIDGVPLPETARRIEKATRVYARRQRTWFRSEPGVNWWTTAEELLSPSGRARIARWRNAPVG